METQIDISALQVAWQAFDSEARLRPIRSEADDDRMVALMNVPLDITGDDGQKWPRNFEQRYQVENPGMKPGRCRSGKKEFFMVKKSARRNRRTHTPAFKARVALAGLREDRTMAEPSKHFELHPNEITDSKRQLL